MKVCVRTPRHLSRAMFRVEAALQQYAPAGVTFVERPAEADLHVLHVIGIDAITYESPARSVSVLQYCFKTAGEGDWVSLWERARSVWSYYDLQHLMPHSAVFYHAPLGVDDAFTQPFEQNGRSIGVMTSGYVSGPGAEAIEQAAHAAASVGLTAAHLGPKPTGLTKPLPQGWWNVHEIEDNVLADLYRHTLWISGLRHVEGFELPALEGLCCGARPILFDRADMRQWYDGHAVFIPEDGDIYAALCSVLQDSPKPVTVEERAAVLDRFNWESIIRGFWERTL